MAISYYFAAFEVFVHIDGAQGNDEPVGTGKALSGGVASGLQEGFEGIHGRA